MSLLLDVFTARRLEGWMSRRLAQTLHYARNGPIEQARRLARTLHYARNGPIEQIGSIKSEIQVSRFLLIWIIVFVAGRGTIASLSRDKEKRV